MSCNYGARVDAVVYGCPATADYTREDWIRLALAALDQADVTPDRLATAYRDGNRQRRNVNGVLFELDEEPPYLTTEDVTC